MIRVYRQAGTFRRAPNVGTYGPKYAVTRGDGEGKGPTIGAGPRPARLGWLVVSAGAIAVTAGPATVDS